MKTPKISIIVPVYNVEQYLKKCIESILLQTYTNIEIILVNDGSTDQSFKICNEYKEKDSRIILINKANGGLSDARNVGLDKATGSYITFIDSDDWITKDYCESLYSIMQKYNADIVACNNIRAESDDTVISTDEKPLISEFSNLEAIKTFQNTGQVMSCAKLYNKNLFKNLRFKMGKIHEDEFIFHRIVYECNKYIYTEKIMYYYRKRENSIIRTAFNLRKLDLLEAYEDRINFFTEKKLDFLKYKTEVEYIYSIKKALGSLYLSDIDNKNDVIENVYRNKLIAVYKKVKYNKYISLKAYVFGKIVSLFPQLFMPIIVKRGVKWIKGA